MNKKEAAKLFKGEVVEVLELSPSDTAVKIKYGKNFSCAVVSGPNNHREFYGSCSLKALKEIFDAKEIQR